MYKIFMAFRKKPYRKKTKKMFRPRKSYRRFIKSRVPSIRNFAPLGLTQAVKLRYVETVSVNPVVTAMADYIFRGNTLTTPNAVAAGHQPYGFDQLMAMYNQYTVVGSKVSVTFSNQVDTPLFVGVAVRDNATSLNGIVPAVMLEQPGINLKLVSPVASAKPYTMSRGLSVKKFFGLRSVVGDADYSGDAANDASKLAYFHVVVGPQLATDIAPVSMTVTIDYYAVFSAPKALAQS